MFAGLATIFGGNNRSQQPQGHGGYQADGGYAFHGNPQNAAVMPSGSMLGSNYDGSQLSPSCLEYDREREDLLDQHVAYYLKQNPQVQQKHNIVRQRPGVYSIDGRHIKVEWHYSDLPDEPGYLIAIDGPLRQPFEHYMQHNENGICYDEKRLLKTSLQQIPKGNRLSFGDTNKVYSRLEAMKVAKEQAVVREQAAAYAKDGMAVPQHELMQKYAKSITQKLHQNRQQKPAPAPAPAPMAPAEPPAAVPVAPPPVARTPEPTKSPAPAPAPANTKSSSKTKAKPGQTHGAPKYCKTHNRTERRKKQKPQNKECTCCSAVIQTNYVEFTLCPTCSEKDHRCMCCGAPAVGAPEAPSTPMQSRSAPQNKDKMEQSPMANLSPMNLFGMPEMFSPQAAMTQSPQAKMSPQAFGTNNAFASHQPMASQNHYASRMAPPMAGPMVSQRPMASQNHYASQNAFASYRRM